MERLNGVLRIDADTPLDEVNALRPEPGAAILFRRGGVWRGRLGVCSGSPGAPVTYGAWGDGPAPIIQPSVAADDPDGWRQEADGLWSVATGVAEDIGNVILDHGDSGCLFRRGSREGLVHDGDFFFDGAAGRVVVRSEAGCPAARWRSVELARKVNAVEIGGTHDAVVEGLAVRYSAAHGFGACDAKRTSLLGCEASWIGGGYLYWDLFGNGIRYGNGIEFWGGAEDILVEGCRVSQCWDAGLTNQTLEAGSVQRNVVWRGNAAAQCEYSYEFWHHGEGGAVENVRVEGNDFRDAGGGWGHAQRWNPNAAHLMLYDTTLPTPGFAVTGNRFSRSADCLARVFNDWRGQATFSGNVWESGGEPLCRYHGRPREGLRHLFPDRLDQTHRDSQAEIEGQGRDARVFAATDEGLRAFEAFFGFGPESLRAFGTGGRERA